MRKTGARMEGVVLALHLSHRRDQAFTHRFGLVSRHVGPDDLLDQTRIDGAAFARAEQGEFGEFLQLVGR